MKSWPHIEKYNGKQMLIVHGQPFILLAGEVHNSNSSSLKTMEKVWEKAEALGMNALLVPVTWELVEPVEGQFDFTLVDGSGALQAGPGGKGTEFHPPQGFLRHALYHALLSL